MIFGYVVALGLTLQAHPFRGFLYQPEAAQHLMFKDHEVFELAKENVPHDTLDEIKKGLMAKDPTPSLYLYAQLQNSKLNFGVVSQISLQQFEEGLIKRHEQTIANRSHLGAIPIDHLGPITLTFEEQLPDLTALFDLYACKQPYLDWKTVDGRQHFVWRLDQNTTRQVQLIFQNQVRALYVLDGHHRLEGCYKYYRSQKQIKNEGERINEDWRYMLGIIFPRDSLQIVQQRRILTFEVGTNVQEVMLDHLRELGQVQPWTEGEQARGEIKACFTKECFRLKFQNKNEGTIEQLDVYFVDNAIVGPLQKKLEVVRTFKAGILKNSLQSNQVSLQYVPISVLQLIQIADRNLTLPAKATWIEPKPGLRAVVRLPEKALSKMSF